MTTDDLAGRKALIKASGIKTGRILDVGIGKCGCMSFFLAGKGFNVIGIDHFPKAVHDSRKKAKNKKFKGSFEARLGNAEDLPFMDNEFDAVSAYHTLHHLKHVQRGVDEMFRVCKEGGPILIADLNEKGRKVYEHEPDEGRFLKSLEKAISAHTDRIRKIEDCCNLMLICVKNSKKRK
jgi:demethylmenaquinone methyltransferase/2-methoxy-6-polyprenyl-1,4-benzoquinol methylase